MKKIPAIDRCRVSGSNNLISVLNLGNQALTGIFPKSKDEKITTVLPLPKDNNLWEKLNIVFVDDRLILN